MREPDGTEGKGTAPPGGKAERRGDHLVSEYDMVYYEDYAVCLSDESLPMLRAMARSREAAFAVTLEGQETVRGEISLPPEEAARLYDLYIDLGGKAQRLDLVRDRWPVQTVKK